MRTRNRIFQFHVTRSTYPLRGTRSLGRKAGPWTGSRPEALPRLVERIPYDLRVVTDRGGRNLGVVVAQPEEPRTDLTG
jgi:hypothetical protein